MNEDKAGRTWQEAIMAFLADHPREIVTVDEVATKTGCKRGSVSTILSSISIIRPECEKLPGVGRYRWTPDQRLDDATAALQLIQHQLDDLRSLVTEQLAVITRPR